MGVEIHHPVTGRTITVSSERVAAIHARSGWELTGAPATVSDELPELAVEVIAWVGQDPGRAAVALEAENERTHPRTTVTEHIEAVLNTTSQED